MDNRVAKEQTENWIDYIIDKTVGNYQGREIVIWGKYKIADSIKMKLLKQYGLSVAFYVDSSQEKQDGKTVFSPDVLCGKSNSYYVIIPLAFYQEIREKLVGGGYEPDRDYYYFCDCIVCQEHNYYEDRHGNRIIGDYTGLKFAFTGFHSVIEIGDDATFHETVFYLHNMSKIRVGCNMQLKQVDLSLGDFAEAVFGKDAYIDEGSINVGKSAAIFLGEDTRIEHNGGVKTRWYVGERSRLEIGNRCIFYELSGIIDLRKNVVMQIGDDFTINGNYHIYSRANIFIGKDCMFSYDISIRGDDGHSIFDILDRKNINSTDAICRERGIVIGNHVWVGERATILYNTEIGDGSIVGAMSLVKGKIPNNCTAAGIPAKILRRDVAWCREFGADDILQCGKEYINCTKNDEM